MREALGICQWVFNHQNEVYIRITATVESELMNTAAVSNYDVLSTISITNGDKVLEQHINESPSNAKYTSIFSIAAMLEAIDMWLERKLLDS